VQTPSGFRNSLITSDVFNKFFPTSPRLPFSTYASGDEDETQYSHKSHRLMKKISTFAHNPSKEFGVKIQTINSIETRKIFSSQSHRPVILSRATSPRNQLSTYDSVGGSFPGKNGETQNRDEISKENNH